MAVFRVERTRDYTVMCNHHLKDSNLSLKAKGLLSMMLSLPDEWNYTTRGLAAICKEGVDAIGKTLKELELAGYIIRRQLRGKDGRISDTEYTIFEKPRKPSPPDTTLPDTENPYLDNPDTEAPDTDNPAQLNTKKSKATPRNDMKKPHHLPISANCGGGSAYFRCMGKLNQAGKQRLSARIRFASANNIFNFAVCFRRPRYRVFRYRNRPFTTPKTCSTFARTDDFSCSLRFN